MLAPDRDIFGQRRVDDPSVSTPGRFRIQRVQGPWSYRPFGLRGVASRLLLQTQDNDSANVDVDRTISYVRLSAGLLDYFSILLSDGEGIGPDSRTVTPRRDSLDRDWSIADRWCRLRVRLQREQSHRASDTVGRYLAK